MKAEIVPAVKFPAPTVDPAIACQLSDNLRAIMQSLMDDNQARMARQAEASHALSRAAATRQLKGSEFLQAATRMLRRGRC